MGKAAQKNQRQLFWKWIFALSAALVLMVALAVSVKGCVPKDTPETPQEKPFTGEDFAWENGRLTCLSRESVPGIDVSYYQGEIDWEQVKASGVEFAFIRLGYRGAKDGILHEDEKARVNLQNAKASGVKIGAYFFSQAVTAEEAREEAAFALEILGQTSLDLPLTYDWEYMDTAARTDGMTSEALMQCVNAFCETVEASGKTAMVYFNLDLANTLLDVPNLGNRPIWFAMYDQAPALTPDYWQYTDEGTVPGIEGFVDLNLYFPQK